MEGRVGGAHHRGHIILGHTTDPPVWCVSSVAHLQITHVVYLKAHTSTTPAALFTAELTSILLLLLLLMMILLLLLPLYLLPLHILPNYITFDY